MTVPIEEANIKSSGLVTSLSRYVPSTVIYWGDLRKITFKTYIRQPYTVTGSEKVMLITPGNEYRPDLVSFDVYGTVDLWWRIMEVNAIYDVFDFKSGMTIILPTQPI